MSTEREELARLVYVGGKGTFGSHERERAWDQSTLPESAKDDYRQRVDELLTAHDAAVEAAVREKVATEIEAERDDRYNQWRDVGINLAAAIARTNPDETPGDEWPGRPHGSHDQQPVHYPHECETHIARGGSR